MSLVTGCKKLSPRLCLTFSSPLLYHILRAHIHLWSLICSNAFILQLQPHSEADGKDSIQYWNLVFSKLSVCVSVGETAKMRWRRETMRRETNWGVTTENVCKNKIFTRIRTPNIWKKKQKKPSKHWQISRRQERKLWALTVKWDSPVQNANHLGSACIYLFVVPPSFRGLKRKARENDQNYRVLSPCLIFKGEWIYF